MMTQCTIFNFGNWFIASPSVVPSTKHLEASSMSDEQVSFFFSETLAKYPNNMLNKLHEPTGDK